MSRKAYALLAGWLAVVPAALAQTPDAGSVRSKIRPLSPYYPTATTAAPAPTPAPAGPAVVPVLPTGIEMSEQPPAMPDIMPRAPVAGRMVAQGVPVTGAPQGVPVTGTPAAAPAMPAAPAMTGGMPVAPPAAGPVSSAPAYGVPSPMPSAPGGAVYSAPAAGGSCGPNGCGNGGCATGSCAPAAGATGCTTAPTCNTGCCTPCGPVGRAWVSAEYLYWRMQSLNTPPLVTATTNLVRIDAFGRPVAGTFADPLARVISSNEYNDDWRSGVRVRGGFWLDECQTCGLEGSYFYLEDANDSETFGPQNGPGIFRPFFNADPNVLGPDAQLVNFGGPVPDGQLVVFPNRLTGTVSINTGTRFQGFDANFRKNLMCDCNSRIDLLAGYRYLRLRDSLQINENLLIVGLDPALGANQLPVGTVIQVQDTFETQNEFNGGQVGLAGEWRSGRAFLGLRGLIALGSTNTDVNVNGFTRVQVPGGVPQTFVGGLLAQRTNIGSRSFDEFSVVPEATVTLGYQLTDGIRAFVSYNYLYWSNVSRAGDQIDLVVDGRQINQTADAFLATRPAPQNTNSDFWAHGVGFGVELRY